MKEAGLIIDCGANVGFASAYLLSRFSRATVISIEPDSQNFAALQKNLASYGTRVTPIQSAIWSHSCGLVMSEAVFGDGREWSRTVRPARSDETPHMVATDIQSLLDRSSYTRISLLKVDIEGAELEVFGSGECEWLDLVDNLVIELHGSECERVFHRAIEGRGFITSRCDELTLCTRQLQ